MDINEEFYLYRNGNGIKLSNPKKCKYPDQLATTFSPDQTVSKIFQLPFSVTILNLKCETQYMNEKSAAALGLESTKSALGKSIRHHAPKKIADVIINNNEYVLKTNQIQIYDENVLLKKGGSYHSLSFKMPLYNDNNKLIGLLGLGIVEGRDKLDSALMLISELGFLTPKVITKNRHILSSKSSKLSKPIDSFYFSKREREILHYSIRGKTAKQCAALLNISPRTVEQHLENIKMKLKVSSKSEMIDNVIDSFL